LVAIFSMDSKHIVILSHENDRKLAESIYYLRVFTEIWCEQGHKLSFVNGTDKMVSGDVIIVHVDLTDVPSEYLEYADQFPVAINGKASTIAKDAFSVNLLDRRTSYNGKVIVKTRANYGGIPEAILRHKAGETLIDLGAGERPWRKVECLDAKDYPIFNSPLEVPPGVWKNPRLIVEKFLPETDGSGNYFTRGWYFFGEANLQYHMMSRNPTVKEIVNDEEGRFVEESLHNPEFQAQPVPQELLGLRRKMNIDFGMMDWGLHDGRVVIYDVHKTPALAPELVSDPEYMAQEKAWALPIAARLWDYL
jgi:hypothetical protein